MLVYHLEYRSVQLPRGTPHSTRITQSRTACNRCNTPTLKHQRLPSGGAERPRARPAASRHPPRVRGWLGRTGYVFVFSNASFIERTQSCTRLNKRPPSMTKSVGSISVWRARLHASQSHGCTACLIHASSASKAALSTARIAAQGFLTVVALALALWLAVGTLLRQFGTTKAERKGARAPFASMCLSRNA